MNKKGDNMNEENKVNFDLSVLSLEELIKVYTKINEFLLFLETTKKVYEEKAEDKND